MKDNQKISLAGSWNYDCDVSNAMKEENLETIGAQSVVSDHPSRKHRLVPVSNATSTP